MKRLSKYLILAFAVAWILQIAAGLLFRNGYRIGYSALLSLSMFAPLLAAAVSGYDLRQLGWKPRIRKNLRRLLTAWLFPIVLGTIGAAIYFLVTPDAWDTTFSYIGEALGAEGIRQLEANELSLKEYAVISTISALTYAPFMGNNEHLGSCTLPWCEQRLCRCADFFLKPAYADKLLLGPLMVGLIGGLPLIITAVIIFVSMKKEK